MNTVNTQLLAIPLKQWLIPRFEIDYLPYNMHYTYAITMTSCDDQDENAMWHYR